jgi:hypothetical protein
MSHMKAILAILAVVVVAGFATMQYAQLIVH